MDDSAKIGDSKAPASPTYIATSDRASSPLSTTSRLQHALERSSPESSLVFIEPSAAALHPGA